MTPAPEPEPEPVFQPLRPARSRLVFPKPKASGLFGKAPAAEPVKKAAEVKASSNNDDMDIDDLRVAVARILGDPDSGRRVIQEANALLDSGTAEEMRAWLKTGYRLAQAEDDRVAIARILADPDSGRRVTAEINQLLDANDPDRPC